MNARFTLGKQERLKSRKKMEKLFREGKVISFGTYRVHYLLLLPQEGHINNSGELTPFLQAGFGVGKSNFKKATDRNSIRRLTRESYRLQKSILQEHLLHIGRGMELFIIYAAREKQEFGSAMSNMQQLLQRLVKITHAGH